MRDELIETLSAAAFDSGQLALGRDTLNKFADRILAIPKIAKARKAYAFATAAVKATGGGVEKVPDLNRKVTLGPPSKAETVKPLNLD